MTISKNTAKMYGGSAMKCRFSDLCEPRKRETRTADEIIANIKNGLAAIIETGKE